MHGPISYLSLYFILYSAGAANTGAATQVMKKMKRLNTHLDHRWGTQKKSIQSTVIIHPYTTN